MGWLSNKSSSALAELKSISECDKVFDKDLTVFFKHSPACPVSWMAHREVTRFLVGHPDAPVYMVLVRQNRDVSLHIESRTGIRHESPQVLVLRNGKVVGHASHDDVTADLLEELTGNAVQPATLG